MFESGGYQVALVVIGSHSTLLLRVSDNIINMHASVSYTITH